MKPTAEEVRIQVIKWRLDKIKRRQKVLFEEEAALIAELRVLSHQVMREMMLK